MSPHYGHQLLGQRHEEEHADGWPGGSSLWAPAARSAGRGRKCRWLARGLLPTGTRCLAGGCEESTMIWLCSVSVQKGNYIYFIYTF